MTKKRKLLIALLSATCLTASVFGLAACGESGTQGEKGETGAQGIQGDKGDAGEKGETGAKGDTGATGNGIAKIEYASDGASLVITYTDGTTTTVAYPVSSSHEHTYGKASVVSLPTYDYDGIATKTCATDGDTELVVISEAEGKGTFAEPYTVSEGLSYVKVGDNTLRSNGYATPVAVVNLTAGDTALKYKVSFSSTTSYYGVGVLASNGNIGSVELDEDGNYEVEIPANSVSTVYVSAEGKTAVLFDVEASASELASGTATAPETISIGNNTYKAGSLESLVLKLDDNIKFSLNQNSAGLKVVYDEDKYVVTVNATYYDDDNWKYVTADIPLNSDAVIPSSYTVNYLTVTGDDALGDVAVELEYASASAQNPTAMELGTEVSSTEEGAINFYSFTATEAGTYVLSSTVGSELDLFNGKNVDPNENYYYWGSESEIYGEKLSTGKTDSNGDTIYEYVTQSSLLTLKAGETVYFRAQGSDEGYKFVVNAYSEAYNGISVEHAYALSTADGVKNEVSGTGAKYFTLAIPETSKVSISVVDAEGNEVDADVYYLHTDDYAYSYGNDSALNYREYQKGDIAYITVEQNSVTKYYVNISYEAIAAVDHTFTVTDTVSNSAAKWLTVSVKDKNGSEIASGSTGSTGVATLKFIPTAGYTVTVVDPMDENEYEYAETETDDTVTEYTIEVTPVVTYTVTFTGEVPENAVGVTVLEYSEYKNADGTVDASKSEYKITNWSYNVKTTYENGKLTLKLKDTEKGYILKFKLPTGYEFVTLTDSDDLSDKVTYDSTYSGYKITEKDVSITLAKVKSFTLGSSESFTVSTAGSLTIEESGYYTFKLTADSTLFSDSNSKIIFNGDTENATIMPSTAEKTSIIYLTAGTYVTEVVGGTGENIQLVLTISKSTEDEVASLTAGSDLTELTGVTEYDFGNNYDYQGFGQVTIDKAGDYKFTYTNESYIGLVLTVSGDFDVVFDDADTMYAEKDSDNSNVYYICSAYSTPNGEFIGIHITKMVEFTYDEGTTVSKAVTISATGTYKFTYAENATELILNFDPDEYSIEIDTDPANEHGKYARLEKLNGAYLLYFTNSAEEGDYIKVVVKSNYIDLDVQTETSRWGSTYNYANIDEAGTYKFTYSDEEVYDIQLSLASGLSVEIKTGSEEFAYVEEWNGDYTLVVESSTPVGTVIYLVVTKSEEDSGYGSYVYPGMMY
jgi:hypothetical protein